MAFKCRPILSTMENLYRQPISPTRFQAYLKLLQGETKGDMILPIAGYNPMAKAHVLEKIKQLQELEAEKLIDETLQKFNKALPATYPDRTISVVINIADDLKGGWTNQYTTDFDSKFKINALVTRNFCAPYFWSSEVYSASLIRERTLAYAYRTLFWLNNPKPLKLEDHLKQEIFVAQKMERECISPTDDHVKSIQQFYTSHQQDDDYNLLFNFFYGDKASQSLGYPAYGIDGMNGFDYACLLAL